MPLRLSVDHPQPVALRWRSGLYATIAMPDDAGRWSEAPVALAAVVPIDDYARPCLTAVDELLAGRDAVAVQASAAARGAFAELPVVEVMLADGRTLGEELVARGLAVPDAALLERHVRHDQLVAALAEARRLHRGAWAEAHPDAAAFGLDAATIAATAPPSTPPRWLSHASWLALIAIVLLIAWREAHWRRARGETPRGRLRRVASLFLGLAAGFGRPLPPTEPR